MATVRFRGQVYPETAAVLSGLSMQYQFKSPPPNSAKLRPVYLHGNTGDGRRADTASLGSRRFTLSGRPDALRRRRKGVHMFKEERHLPELFVFESFSEGGHAR